MGATLSKLWAAIRGALNGSTPASNPQNTDTAGKDFESGTHSPANTTDVATMSEVKKYEITEPWLRLNCSLGEGPFWEDDTNSLRFLDVEKQRIHRVDLAVGPSSHKIVKEFDISIGCTADIENDPTHFVFAGKYGYGIAHKSTGEYHWIKRVWSPAETSANKPHLYRGNDGAVDSSGRFWAGFMFDPLTSPWDEHGALFRLDTDGILHRPLSDIAIPNGTAWTEDEKTMYWADSPKKTIYRFDFDSQTGAISNQRPFFVMPEDNRYGADAVPDGHCIDEEGHMWTALHGGSHVLRISPQGEIVAEIKVPTQQPTCPCFVGKDLVITSAGGTSGEGGKSLDEFAGSVFRIHVGVRGLKRFKYKGGVDVEGGKEGGVVVRE